MFSEGISPMAHPSNTILVAKNYVGGLARRYERYDNLTDAYADADENNPNMQIIVYPGHYVERGAYPVWKSHLHLYGGVIVESDIRDAIISDIDPGSPSFNRELYVFGCLEGDNLVTGDNYQKVINITGQGIIKGSPPTTVGGYKQAAFYNSNPTLALNIEVSEIQPYGAAFYSYPQSPPSFDWSKLKPSILKVGRYLGLGGGNLIDADGTAVNLIFDGGYVSYGQSVANSGGALFYTAMNATDASNNSRPRIRLMNMLFEGKDFDIMFIHEDISSPTGGVVVTVENCRFYKRGTDSTTTIQIDVLGGPNSSIEFVNCVFEVPSTCTYSVGDYLGTGASVRFINSRANKGVSPAITEITALTVDATVKA